MGNARGRKATSGPAHVAAADTFSLIRLRRRRARLWLTAAGVTSLATIYVGPLAIALHTPGPVTTVSPLPTLRVPYVSFAELAVPKLHAAPVIAPTAPALHVGNKHIKTRIPVISDSYSLSPSSIAPTKTPADLFAQTPTVSDDAGAPATISAPPAPAVTAPAATPPSPADSTPAAATPAAPARGLQIVKDATDDSTTPQDAPATPSQQTISSGGAGTISTGSDPAVSSGPAPQLGSTDTTITVPDPTSPSLQVNTPGTSTIDTSGVSDPAAAPPQTSGTSVAPSDPSGDPASQSQNGPAPVAGAGSGSAGGSGTNDGQQGTSGDSGTTAAPSGSDSSDPTGVTPPPPDPAATPGSGPSPPAAWNVALSDASHTVSIAVTADALVVTVDGVASSRPVSSVTSLTVTGGAGDDSFDVSAGSLPVPVALGGGAGNDTLHGPAADSTWTISGAGSGSVAGIDFSGFENLAGAAGNKDTFVFGAGGSISGLVDGGAGGYDAIVIAGHPNTVVSNPTDADSGNLVVDGATITYTGLEDPDVSAMNIVINGGEDTNASPLPQGDTFKISPYVDPSSPTPACQTAGACIQVQDYDTLGVTLSVLNYFVIAGTSSLTIHGGAGADKTEFTGSYLVPNSTLTIDTESIKVDSGFTVDVGTGQVNFLAASTDDGTDALGIDTTLLGDDASIELDSATVNAGSVDFEASSENAKTTVNGGGQALTGTGDTLTVATTTPFLSSGKFTIAGITGTCSFTGTSNRTQFTGVSGCIGTPADKAAIASVGILENGSGTGINHAGLQLIYSATINVHGSSTITASSGDVTMASTVNVTGTANAAGAPDKGTWTSGIAYSKGDVVTDPSDGNRYDAKNTLTAAANTTNPSGDNTDWEKADSKDSSVAATVLVATAQSQLSDTSSISAANGNVKITSSLTSNVTTVADSSAAGSGAGIAVGVVVTTSQAFIDSTNATPVTAKSLTVTADTADNAPTTGKSSPNGSKGNDTNANSPTDNPANGGSSAQSTAAGGKADNQSKTSDGNENLSAALAVTVLVATTQAYLAPHSGSAQINVGTGTILVHAGASASSAAIADAGNVKFSPDAPTLSASPGGALVDSTTYYYTVTATFAGGSTTAAAGAQTLSGTGDTLMVASTASFGSSGKFTVTGLTGTCAYTGITGGNQFTGVSGCTGSTSGGEAVTEIRESLPSPEANLAIASGATNLTIGLSWTAVANATGYRVYRATTSGQETFLAPASGTTFTDNGSLTPSTTDKAPTTDPNSGIGVAVAVNVVDLTTRAYLDGNLTLTAATVTVETVAPSAAATTVNGALQNLVGGTLIVASTTGFASAGTFQVAGNHRNMLLHEHRRDALPRDHRLHRHPERHRDRHLRQLDLHRARHLGRGRQQRRRRRLDRHRHCHLDHGFRCRDDLPGRGQRRRGAHLAVEPHQQRDRRREAVERRQHLRHRRVLRAEHRQRDDERGPAERRQADRRQQPDADVDGHRHDDHHRRRRRLGRQRQHRPLRPGRDLALERDHERLGRNRPGPLDRRGSHRACDADGQGDDDGDRRGQGRQCGHRPLARAHGGEPPRRLAARPQPRRHGRRQLHGGRHLDDGQRGDRELEGRQGQGRRHLRQGRERQGRLEPRRRQQHVDGCQRQGLREDEHAGGEERRRLERQRRHLGRGRGRGGDHDDHLAVARPDRDNMAVTQRRRRDARHLGQHRRDSQGERLGHRRAAPLNIGAAVAIVLATVTNAAVVGTDVLLNSHGLSLTAAMRNNAGDSKHSFDAEATSGAGKGKVGIAGSLALTIANVTTSAEIKSNGARAPPVLNASDVTLSATASVASTDKAMAKDTSAGTVGIGAGAAINIVFDTTTASIDDGAALTGAKNVTLSATDTDANTTYAEAGASGAKRLRPRAHRGRGHRASDRPDERDHRRRHLADAHRHRRRQRQRHPDGDGDDDREGRRDRRRRRHRPRSRARGSGRRGHRDRFAHDRRHQGQLLR